MADSRLTQLINKLESGDRITPQDVHRVSVLQALDLAVAAREFVEQTRVREDEHTRFFREMTNVSSSPG